MVKPLRGPYHETSVYRRIVISFYSRKSELLLRSDIIVESKDRCSSLLGCPPWTCRTFTGNHLLASLKLLKYPSFVEPNSVSKKQNKQNQIDEMVSEVQIGDKDRLDINSSYRN